MDLVKSNVQLPTTLEDLSKFVLVGREKLTAVRAEIKAIEKLGLAKEVREQKIQEAQLLSEALLEAEARIGEMLKDIPKAPVINNLIKPLQSNTSETLGEFRELVIPKEKVLRDMGFSKIQAHRFETLADNKEVIEQVKAEARENEDIPTRTEVLRRVQETKKQEKIQRQKEQIIEKAKINKSLKGKILEGDFFYEINKVSDNSIDLLFVDPPYMVLNEDWDKYKNLQEFMIFTENWLKLSIAKVKQTGRIYICFSQWYQFELYKALEKNNFFGFNFGQVIIWNYRNNNQPSNRKEYRYAYEPIFYLYGKEAKELNFTPDTYGETQSNVWTIATPQSNYNEGKFHPAQKPLELLDRIIKTGSKENDLILDPFAGSGTTGIVAEKLNRQYILIEKDKNYIEIAKGRLNGLD